MNERSQANGGLGPHPIGIWPAILFAALGVYADHSLRSVAVFGLLLLVVYHLYYAYSIFGRLRFGSEEGNVHENAAVTTWNRPPNYALQPTGTAVPAWWVLKQVRFQRLSARPLGAEVKASNAKTQIRASSLVA